MRFASSIQFRLTAWYAAILTVTFLALGIGVWAAIRTSIYDTVDSELNSRVARARDFLNHMHRDVRGIREELAEQTAFSSAGTTVRLADRQGNWIYQSPGTSSSPISVQVTGLAQDSTVGGKHLRILTAEVAAGILEIGVPLDGYESVLAHFTWWMVLASPLALLLASAGGYWMSRHALAPVARITRMAREISANNLSDRLPEKDAGDELDRLSATLNAMFERLEAAFRRITQFTADASHELRTPVAIIRTTAEMAISRPRTPDQHAGSWRMVLAESERTTKLLNDLMTLARADSGSDGMELTSIDFAGCVREACEGVRVLVDAAGLRMRVETPLTAPVAGDYEALRRLCLILLDNAIKYSSAGGTVAVVLTTSGTEAALKIQDSGIGISIKDQPHVFDRFYRASKDRSRQSGGAGLGLAIAGWIASRHGGTITVESALGEGSTFRVTMPLFTSSSESEQRINGQEVVQ